MKVMEDVDKSNIFFSLYLHNIASLPISLSNFALKVYFEKKVP